MSRFERGVGFDKITFDTVLKISRFLDRSVARAVLDPAILTVTYDRSAPTVEKVVEIVEQDPLIDAETKSALCELIRVAFKTFVSAEEEEDEPVRDRARVPRRATAPRP